MKRERREKNPNLSRREFVKTAAAGLGAATLGGVASTEAEAEGRGLKWDREADVVVVGAGAAARLPTRARRLLSGWLPTGSFLWRRLPITLEPAQRETRRREKITVRPCNGCACKRGSR